MVPQPRGALTWAPVLRSFRFHRAAEVGSERSGERALTDPFAWR